MLRGLTTNKMPQKAKFQVFTMSALEMKQSIVTTEQILYILL